MPKLDRAFANEAVERLRRIAPDAKPAWGELNGTTVIHHLLWATNYSMGEHGQQHFNGNWVFENIVGPLAVNGILPLPKGVKFKTATGETDTALQEAGDVDALAAALEEFIRKEEAGELRTPKHAFFGDIGPAGWSKLHVVHVKHHMKQFGV
jgi:hypothetical protein